jgi:hypothetical protein
LTGRSSSSVRDPRVRRIRPVTVGGLGVAVERELDEIILAAVECQS